MNPAKGIPNPSSLTYLEFIWKKSFNRRLLLRSLASIVITFGLFKIIYPFPDFFGDSYSYIQAAKEHLDISIWPIGYSKFLGWFHIVSASPTALVAFQYFTVQVACLHFLFSLLYLINLRESYASGIAIFFMANPFTLYLCNTVNSDALFSFFSLLWLTTLVWLICRPKPRHVFTHAILVFCCFTIRNNAYYYPLVSITAFLLSEQSVYRKMLGILLPFVFIIPFVLFTREACYRVSGTRQFSLFTGWQLANNALYMYDQIEVDSTDLAAPESRELNRYAMQFVRSVNPEVYRDYLENYVGNFFIREPGAPLKRYYGSHFTFKTEKDNIVNWAKASAVFEPFGKTLLLTHPFAYGKYFILPNAKHYAVPPLSHIGRYNYGIEEIDTVAKEWFQLGNIKPRIVSADFQGTVLLPYIGIFLLLNILYLYSIGRTAILFNNKLIKDRFAAIQLVMLVFILLNFLFSVSTTVNILRYQHVSMLAITGVIWTLYSYPGLPTTKKSDIIRSAGNESYRKSLQKPIL